MQGKKMIAKILTGVLMLAFLAIPQLSFADWRGHHDGDRHDGHFYRYHDHPHFGLHLHYLPDGYFSLWMGGVRYYYYDGVYYNYFGGDYVIVSPPVGAIVSTVPSDFQPVVVNGATYYVDNGTYYLYTPHGYQVVTQPAATVVTTPYPAVVAAAPAAVLPEDSFTLNIPNNSGGYTAVVIKRSGNGFSGPQGEFYQEFPKVSQLKVMYAK